MVYKIEYRCGIEIIDDMYMFSYVEVSKFYYFVSVYKNVCFFNIFEKNNINFD